MMWHNNYFPLSNRNVSHCRSFRKCELPSLFSQSESDREFVSQSIEAELVQLFKSYDDLCEQRQELENKLDEAEDTTLP